MGLQKSQEESVQEPAAVSLIQSGLPGWLSGLPGSESSHGAVALSAQCLAQHSGYTFFFWSSGGTDLLKSLLGSVIRLFGEQQSQCSSLSRISFRVVGGWLWGPVSCR